MEQPRFLLTGDTSLSVEFGSEISEAINRRIRAFGLALEAAAIPGVTELVPTYRSMMIHYNPEVIGYAALTARLTAVLGGLDQIPLPPSQVLEIPVLYGGEAGPDLAFVAEHAGLTPEEVIARHTKPEYLIYMLGFTPGFTYLGGLDERLNTPRLAQPRVSIPAGSVGIAGSQTGVYPIASPGGWQLIGRTPVLVYDRERENPILYKSGDYIRFVPISRDEYFEIEKAVQGGTYTVQTEEVRR